MTYLRQYLIFIILLILSCKITEKPFDFTPFKVTYDGSPKDSTEKFALYFIGGFKDSIMIKQNDTYLNTVYLKSDWSTNFTGFVETVEMKFGDKIEINEPSSGSKIFVKLIIGYSIIEISKYSNEWAILYTNRSSVFE